MKRTRIKTVVIEPTRDMPLALYQQCWHLSYFMELMERVGPREVIWDEGVESIFDKRAAEAEYHAFRAGYINCHFELPEAFAARLGVPNTQAQLFSGATA